MSLRVRGAGTADPALAVGLPYHLGGQSLSERRPLSHPFRGLDHHLRRALLHRQNLRLRVSQRHLHSRRKRQQIHEAENLRDPSRASLLPLGRAGRFQNHNLRREGGEGQDFQRLACVGPSDHDLAARAGRDRVAFSEVRALGSAGELNKNLHLRGYKREGILQRPVRAGLGGDGLDAAQMRRADSLLSAGPHGHPGGDQHDHPGRLRL